MKRTAGFTLIEILVMSGVIVIAGAIAVSVFFSLLRSSTKSKIETNLKEKGQFALNSMEKLIRTAWRIENIETRCPPNGQSGNSLTIYDENDLPTTLSCTATQVASNSVVLVDGANINCDQFITCQWSGSGPPKITIKFSLSLGNSGPALPYQSARLDFQTTVVPRNIH